MTLIVARASSQIALLVSDRRVTRDGALFDPDANKNILFTAKNAVVAIGYTGMAHVSGVPMDQWIAQTLTGLTFPEGRHGPGSVPTFMTTRYEERYWGMHVQTLHERLNNMRSVLPASHRALWSQDPFDLLATGWEWNHGFPRPLLLGLSKPTNSTVFALDAFKRHWYFRGARGIQVRTVIAPASNVLASELGSVRAADVNGQSAEDAESLLADLIRTVSARSDLVGPDLMSIRFTPVTDPDPTIRIRYLSADRNTGVLIRNTTRTAVPIAFSPWILSPGFLSAPAVFTDLGVQSRCGPYRVFADGPPGPGFPCMVSSQRRPPL